MQNPCKKLCVSRTATSWHSLPLDLREDGVFPFLSFKDHESARKAWHMDVTSHNDDDVKRSRRAMTIVIDNGLTMLSANTTGSLSVKRFQLLAKSVCELLETQPDDQLFRVVFACEFAIDYASVLFSCSAPVQPHPSFVRFNAPHHNRNAYASPFAFFEFKHTTHNIAEIKSHLKWLSESYRTKQELAILPHLLLQFTRRERVCADFSLDASCFAHWRTFDTYHPMCREGVVMKRSGENTQHTFDGVYSNNAYQGSSVASVLISLQATQVSLDSKIVVFTSGTDDRAGFNAAVVGANPEACVDMFGGVGSLSVYDIARRISHPLLGTCNVTLDTALTLALSLDTIRCRHKQADSAYTITLVGIKANPRGQSRGKPRVHGKNFSEVDLSLFPHVKRVFVLSLTRTTLVEESSSRQQQHHPLPLLCFSNQPWWYLSPEFSLFDSLLKNVKLRFRVASEIGSHVPSSSSSSSTSTSLFEVLLDPLPLWHPYFWLRLKHKRDALQELEKNCDTSLYKSMFSLKGSKHMLGELEKHNKN